MTTPHPVPARRVVGLIARLTRQADKPAPEENLTAGEAKVMGAVGMHRHRGGDGLGAGGEV